MENGTIASSGEPHTKSVGNDNTARTKNRKENLRKVFVFKFLTDRLLGKLDTSLAVRESPRHPCGYRDIGIMLQSHGMLVKSLNDYIARSIPFGAVFNQLWKSFVGIIASRSSDVCLSYSMEGALLISLSSLIPSKKPGQVLFLQANLNPAKEGFRSRLREKLFLRATAHADIILSVLFEQVKLLRGMYPRKADDIRYCPVGADTKFYDPTRPVILPANSSLTSLEERPFLLVVGDAKRDDHFIYSALKDRPMPLIRVTRNPSVVVLTRPLCKSFGHPEDRILQLISFNELRWLFKNCSAYLMAGDDTWEPLGITSLTEAMAMGAPCIFNSGGCVEREMRHLATESGVALSGIEFFPSGDARTFKKAVDHIVSLNPKHRAQLSTMNRQLAETAFPVERSYETILQAIEDAASWRD